VIRAARQARISTSRFVGATVMRWGRPLKTAVASDGRGLPPDRTLVALARRRKRRVQSGLIIGHRLRSTRRAEQLSSVYASRFRAKAAREKKLLDIAAHRRKIAFCCSPRDCVS